MILKCFRGNLGVFQGCSGKLLFSFFFLFRKETTRLVVGSHTGLAPQPDGTGPAGPGKART